MKPFDPHDADSKNRLLGLWRLMTGNRLRYVAAALFTGIATVSQTGTYLLLRHFIDVALPQHTLSAILQVAAGFILLATFQGTFSFLAGRLSAGTAEETARRLRNAFYDHVQKLPFGTLDRTPTGDLVERATSDMDAVRRFYSDQAIGFGRVVLQLGVNFAAVVTLNASLALSSVAVMPLVLGVSVIFFRAISRRYEKYQEQESILSTTLQENLTGVRVVKAFARQELERNRFEAVNAEKLRRGKRLVTMNALFWPLTDVLCSAQMVAGFVFGAILAIRGTITLGTYMAFVGMVVQIIWPIRFLGRLIVDISSGLVSFERVMSILREPREALDEGAGAGPAGSAAASVAAGNVAGGPAGNAVAPRLRGEIVFDRVGFGYDPTRPILTDVSFSCMPGQSVALLGSTGSGKTSLVSLVPRFYEISTGRITLDGQDIRRYTRRFLRSQVGLVEQQPFLFSRSIRENIRYGVAGDVSQERIEEAARASSLHDVIMSFPDGYETMVGEKGVTLSGGQKQRVAIARAILRDPRILILDDSTSSVDTETEAGIRAALERLMAGRTTFVIAHRIQSLMKADLILVFDRGRIVQRGNHESLVSVDGIYRRIFDMQTRIESELAEEIDRVRLNT